VYRKIISAGNSSESIARAILSQNRQSLKAAGLGIRPGTVLSLHHPGTAKR
jgi:hypothetical protein